MAEPVQVKKTIDEWEGVLKPYVGQIVLHYKVADKTSTPAPAVVTKLGSNKRVAGLRMIHGGMYFEAFPGAAHMDYLFQQDGTEMTPMQKQNIGGWEHTDETKAFVRLQSEVERMGRTVVELAATLNAVVERIQPKTTTATKPDSHAA